MSISSDAELVLFGGATGPRSFDTISADTWLLTDGSWRRLDVAGPSARLSPAMGYDPDTGLHLLYGGFGGDGSELGDTWAFDGAAWQCVDNC
jgi:hypothetical protein